MNVSIGYDNFITCNYDFMSILTVAGKICTVLLIQKSDENRNGYFKV